MQETTRKTPAIARPKSPTRAQNARTSIWMLLIAEFMLFFGFLSSFFFLRSFMSSWGPPTGRSYDLTLPLINTAVILVSAGTMYLAFQALRKDKRRVFENWLLVTMLLGAGFIVGQVFEFAALGFAIQDGAYAGIFLMTIGVHAAHVAIGVLLFMLVSIRAWIGLVSAQRSLAVELCALYWYFVALMWIVIFAILYFL